MERLRCMEEPLQCLSKEKEHADRCVKDEAYLEKCPQTINITRMIAQDITVCLLT
jgi:hypothetical protein